MIVSRACVPWCAFGRPTVCRRDKAIFKDRDCGGLDYCKLFPIATSDAAVSPSTCSELRDAKRESCTFSQDEKALPLLQRLTNAVNPADPAGQQLTLSFWMRALPSAHTPLMPKLRIFGSLGSAHPAGQQTLLDVSYHVQSGAVRVQVCAHVPARVCVASALMPRNLLCAIRRCSITVRPTGRLDQKGSTRSSSFFREGCRKTAG